MPESQKPPAGPVDVYSNKKYPSRSWEEYETDDRSIVMQRRFDVVQDALQILFELFDLLAAEAIVIYIL